MKEEGRRKKEEGRRKRGRVGEFPFPITNSLLPIPITNSHYQFPI
jgi:hypothetical protein